MLKFKKEIKFIDALICSFYIAFCLEIFWIYLVEWALEPLFEPFFIPNPNAHPSPFSDIEITFPSFSKGYMYLAYLWMIFYIVCMIMINKITSFYREIYPFFRRLFVRVLFLPFVYFISVFLVADLDPENQVKFHFLYYALIALGYFLYSVSKSFNKERIMSNFNGAVPPGADVDNNVKEALEYAKQNSALDTLNWFKDKVQNKGVWDYKQIDRKYENFGNFNYGVVGRALGIPEGVLISGASAVQRSSNDGSNFITNLLADYFNSLKLNPNNVRSFGLWDDLKDKTNILDGFDYFKERFGKSEISHFDTFEALEKFYNEFNENNQDTYENLKEFYITGQYYNGWLGETVKECFENLMGGNDGVWEMIGGDGPNANAIIIFKGSILTRQDLEMLLSALSLDPTSTYESVIDRISRFLDNR